MPNAFNYLKKPLKRQFNGLKLTLKYDAADLPAFTMTGDIGVLEWSGGTGRGLTGVALLRHRWRRDSG